MLNTEKRCIRTGLAALVTLMFVFYPVVGPAASALPPQGPAVKGLVYGVRGHSAPTPEMRTILSVLEERSEDGRLVEKAKQKLAALDKEDLMLITSLCRRIGARGDEAGADIAFLMTAMLVVLS